MCNCTPRLWKPIFRKKAFEWCNAPFDHITVVSKDRDCSFGPGYPSLQEKVNQLLAVDIQQAPIKPQRKLRS
jgi:hypothetical protein